jgi:hypothetical protein
MNRNEFSYELDAIDRCENLLYQSFRNVIREAIDNKSAVEIEYVKADGEYCASRVIRPISFYRDFGHTYVRAFCQLRRAERSFRIDRILSAKLSGAARETNADNGTEPPAATAQKQQPDSHDITRQDSEVRYAPSTATPFSWVIPGLLVSIFLLAVFPVSLVFGFLFGTLWFFWKSRFFNLKDNPKTKVRPYIT